MSTVKLVVPVLLMAACTPQNAVLTGGSYVAFFDDSLSLSLANEEVDPTNADFAASWNVDCRYFETRQERRDFQLEDSVPCGPLRIRDNNGSLEGGAFHEVWANQAGFRVVHEQLEPWRGEAVVGTEGDLQIGFHHRLPGGADMRFIMAVDPDFQPTECVGTADGGVEEVDKDGDWIEEWSKELPQLADLDDRYQGAYEHLSDYIDGGRLFFLNSQSYQVNPREVRDNWVLPDQFEAGVARGKISEEDLIGRRSVWAFPFVYSGVDDPEDDANAVPFDDRDLWFCDLPEGADPNDTLCLTGGRFRDMNGLETTIIETANETYDELEQVFTPDDEAVFEYRPLTHANRWRISDGVPSGFDGWGEMHYSYIVFSEDSNLEVGGSAEGAFSIAMEARDSWTQVFIKGTFEIDVIRADRWTTDDLRSIKAEEAGIDLCFQQ